MFGTRSSADALPSLRPRRANRDERPEQDRIGRASDRARRRVTGNARLRLAAARRRTWPTERRGRRAQRNALGSTSRFLSRSPRFRRPRSRAAPPSERRRRRSASRYARRRRTFFRTRLRVPLEGGRRNQRPGTPRACRRRRVRLPAPEKLAEPCRMRTKNAPNSMPSSSPSESYFDSPKRRASSPTAPSMSRLRSQHISASRLPSLTGIAYDDRCSISAPARIRLLVADQADSSSPAATRRERTTRRLGSTSAEAGREASSANSGRSPTTTPSASATSARTATPVQDRCRNGARRGRTTSAPSARPTSMPRRRAHTALVRKVRTSSRWHWNGNQRRGRARGPRGPGCPRSRRDERRDPAGHEGRASDSLDPMTGLHRSREVPLISWGMRRAPTRGRAGHREGAGQALPNNS